MAVRVKGRLDFFYPIRRWMGLDWSTHPDWVLVVIIAMLSVIGVMMIYSVTVGPNVQVGRDDPFATVEKHLVALGLGILVLLFLTYSDYHIWQRLAVPMMLATLVALSLLLIFGQEEQGAKRWLLNGSFQPGEVAKLVTVIYIAAWLSSKGKKLRHPIYGLLPFGILVGLVAGLIVLEPNYSTAILIALTALAMFFIAGADLIQFSLSLIIGTATAALVISRSPRAVERLLLVLTDPFKSQGDQFWQLAQTLIALASGGLFGKGLGTGGGQYGYVPLAHSDGIFAIWGEETGLVGTFLLVGIFLLLAYRGFKLASNAPDSFGRVLAAGVTFWLVFQAFINIGVVTQLIPFTGQPLPFISFGGSSLVAALAGVGLLLSISRGKPLPIVVKSVPRVPSGAPPQPKRQTKENNASLDNRWRNGRARVPASRRSPTTSRRPRTGSKE